MATAYFTLLFALMCVVQVRTLRPGDLEMLGVQLCPTKNTCQQMGNADFSERICECDQHCSFYGDCCIDVPSSRARQMTREICMQFGDLLYQGAFVTGSCPDSYVGPPEITTQCRNGNVSDPIMSAPVTDTRNDRTYLNQYCALCNDASSTSLQSWIVSMTCSVRGTPGGSTQSFQDISFRADLNRWGIQRENRFQACDLTYDKPSYIQRGFRLCRANVISACPSSYRRTQYVRACSKYTSIVTDKKNKLYKNPHCAICNGVVTDDIECFNPTLFGRKAKPFSFALLLDVNRSDGDIVGEVQRCPSGEKWDPFFKKCRRLVCAIPGFKMVNGKCQKQ